MKIFNHTAHKALWIWLSENPKMWKEDWPGWKVNGGNYGKVDNDCFACEVSFCSECSLEWPHENCMGHRGAKGLYNKWMYNEDLKERATLALQIANLPVKEGVETE